MIYQTDAASLRKVWHQSRVYETASYRRIVHGLSITNLVTQCKICQTGMNSLQRVWNHYRGVDSISSHPYDRIPSYCPKNVMIRHGYRSNQATPSGTCPGSICSHPDLRLRLFPQMFGRSGQFSILARSARRIDSHVLRLHPVRFERDPRFQPAR